MHQPDSARRASQGAGRARGDDGGSFPTTERANPGPMLIQRIITAIILGPVAVAAILFLPTPVVAPLLGLLLLGALFEWARLIGFGAAGRAAYVLAGAALMAVLWLLREHGPLHVALGAGVLWWAVSPLWLKNFNFGATATDASTLLKAIAGMLVVVPAWAAAMLLHAIPDQGPWWVLLVLLLVWCADTGAYFAGRSFGKAKLAPRISPGKTWAGVYGGLLASAAGAAGGGWLLGLRGAELALLVGLAVIAVIFSIVGDLFESLIKRHAGAKDSGTIFPGHGGIFDRLDSFFAALPVFTAGKLALGL